MESAAVEMPLDTHADHGIHEIAREYHGQNHQSLPTVMSARYTARLPYCDHVFGPAGWVRPSRGVDAIAVHVS